MSGAVHGLLASLAGVIKDTFFRYVSLLLNTTSTNGAQNNTFLDGSTNNFSITRNGNTTQGTFSPFSQTGWSNYFDGNGDWLATPSTSNLAMGTGNFCVEMWIYPTSLSGDMALYFNAAAGGVDTQMAIFIRNANSIRFSSWDTVFLDSSVGSIVGNVWQHIVVCRSGSTASLFINGSRAATATVTNNFSSTDAFQIGRRPANDQFFTGYISNLRAVKGSSVYDPTQTTLTVPTSPLTAITNTSLLTCQSNRFIDNSSNAFAITRNGDVSVQAFSPFAPTAAWSASTNGGGGYFDGAGDFLSLPDNAALEPGSSDLTWEMWINTTASNQYATIYGRGTTWAAGAWLVLINNASATAGDVAVWIHDFSNAAPLLVSTGVNVRDAAWHHIAVVRNGSAWTLYVDGVSRATATWAGTVTDRADGPNVARDPTTPTTRDFPGYISNLRIVKGTAVYTANFTPPTAPLTAITNTSLLLNFTNAGIYDSASGNDLETVGNAQVSTVQSKWGTTSMAFDGTGDWLAQIDRPALRLGTAAFTIEMWVYRSASGTYGLVSKGTSTTGWSVSLNASNQVVFSFAASSFNSTGTVAATTWTHIAVVREGTGASQTKIYINGTNDGTGTVATDFSGTDVMYVGADRVAGSAFNGYIDDLRITNGYARYTSNFTAPTAAFPLQ